MASNGRVTVLAMNGGSVVRFARDGRPLDAEAIVLAGEVTPGAAAIATNGSEFLVAWSQGSEAGPNRLGVYGKRLDASGWPMDAASFVIADTPQSETEPRIASDGTDFLVVYHLPSSNEVRSKRVLRNGTLADATGAQDGELVGIGARADVARFGGRYLVVLAASWQPLARAVVVDRRGVPTDTTVDLTTGPADHVLAESDGNVWIAYSRADDAPAIDGVPRVFVRPLLESSRRRSARQ